MEKIARKINTAKLIRVLGLLLVDIIFFNLSSVLALLIRFEFNLTELRGSGFLLSIEKIAPFGTVIALAIFYVFDLYNSLWDYAGPREFAKVAAASVVTGFAQVFLAHIFNLPLPRSFSILFTLFLGLTTGLARFSYRYIRRIRRKHLNKKRTMIIGAGQAGAMVLKEMQTNPDSDNKAVCFIDDNRRKWGTFLNGVKVVGGREDIVNLAETYKIDEIFFAIPSMTLGERKKVLDIAGRTGKVVKVLPSLTQISSGQVHLSQFRKVQVEDLLARDPITIDMTGIRESIVGKVVLVTGGGGSIGSELCRQIATYDPKCLIIFDIYENNAYAIQQELIRKQPNLHLEVLIGSVRDEDRLNAIFEQYRPQLVFHAAAHKHVPLMEDSPHEAIKNNVFGTYKVAKACDRYAVERMLLISTDKAVNPTNVMGASKRMCEMIVQMMNNHSETDYVAVRFGNVLGSNGSVIPLFKKQIEAGGPVTVTDKNMIRYFMTIPEAVSLILEAGTFAEGGEIFVLDMGKPVKIDDMARQMISLSGFVPDVDIKIEYTGLRPGEKLYEELLMAEEGIKKTPNNAIFIGHPLNFDESEFCENLKMLDLLCQDESSDIRPQIKRTVPTYQGIPDGAEACVK
ncbi:MAG: polysaccharide biosynthesis protein [Eubacteriales bacterium]